MTANSASKKAIRDYAATHGVPYTQARTELAQQNVKIGVIYTIEQSNTDPLGSRPYPWLADIDGNLAQQDLWQGDPARVIGFQMGDEQRVVLPWSEFVSDPTRALGLTPVMVSRAGQLFAWSGEITNVRPAENPIWMT